MLLDNALSAVDHHTAHHIFTNLLKDSMRDKATILITHQVEFLPQCDKVAIMDEGNMIYFGPWNTQAQQLLSKVLPTSHLLAAAGGAEERKPAPKKKAVSAASSSGLSLSATNIKDNLGKKKDRPATSLTLGKASWIYMKFGRLLPWVPVGFFSLIWFLSAQTSRQMSDYWWVCCCAMCALLVLPAAECAAVLAGLEALPIRCLMAAHTAHLQLST